MISNFLWFLADFVVGYVLLNSTAVFPTIKDTGNKTSIILHSGWGKPLSIAIFSILFSNGGPLRSDWKNIISKYVRQRKVTAPQSLSLENPPLQDGVELLGLLVLFSTGFVPHEGVLGQGQPFLHLRLLKALGHTLKRWRQSLLRCLRLSTIHNLVGLWD